MELLWKWVKYQNSYNVEIKNLPANLQKRAIKRYEIDFNKKIRDNARINRITNKAAIQLWRESSPTHSQITKETNQALLLPKPLHHNKIIAHTKQR